MRRTAAVSGGALVAVVQPAEDWDGDDVVRVVARRPRRDTRFRHALAPPLMRPGLGEIGDVLAEHAAELPLAEQQQVIEAVPPDAPQGALRDRVGAWRPHRRVQGGDAARLG